VDAKDGCEDYFTRSGRNLFGRGAPLLSSVELCGISLQLCKPPLGTLTRLKLHIDAMAAEMSFDEFRESFKVMSTTLTHLEVEGIIFQMLGGEGSPIEFLSLTSLDIRYPYYITGDDDDGDYISHLCDCIHAPALKSLSLFYLNGEQFHTVMNSLRFQKVVGTKTGLKSLCLREIDINDYTGDFALACPNIFKLTLTGDATTKSVLQFILETDQKFCASNVDTALLWPNLRTLSVSSYDDEVL
jgi:hypothetical protein